MVSRIHIHAITLALVLSLSGVSTPSLADEDAVTGDRGSDMVVDLVVTRPLGVVATVLGSAAFVVSLPFTIPSGSVAESACALVERPAAYTFKRPLGDLDECTGGGCKPCGRVGNR